jgi:hypothetical protein
MNVIRRIIGSKKVILALVPILVNVVASMGGLAVPGDAVMLLVDGTFAILVSVQGLLDFKWGSQSDGSGG